MSSDNVVISVKPKGNSGVHEPVLLENGAKYQNYMKQKQRTEERAAEVQIRLLRNSTVRKLELFCVNKEHN